jgi:hypothetical protein
MAAFRAAARITSEANMPLNDDMITDPVNKNQQSAGAMIGYARADAWFSRLAAQRAEVKIDALTDKLAEHEVRLLAAVRLLASDPDAHVTLGPEQYKELLAALPPIVQEGLREALARAGEK